MTGQVYGIFNNVEDAERAIAALKDHGAGGNEVSVVRRSDGTGVPSVENAADHAITTTSGADAASGAAKGAAAGLALGILGSAIALTVPGIGPILAAGPLAAALGATVAATAAGAAAGGTVGYLVDQGVSADAAHRYDAAVQRGDILVAVRSVHMADADAALILGKYGATDVEHHGVGAPAGVAEPPILDTDDDLETTTAPPVPAGTPSASAGSMPTIRG